MDLIRDDEDDEEEENQNQMDESVLSSQWKSNHEDEEN